VLDKSIDALIHCHVETELVAEYPDNAKNIDKLEPAEDRPGLPVSYIA
jgi:hypothetical protein